MHGGCKRDVCQMYGGCMDESPGSAARRAPPAARMLAPVGRAGQGSQARWRPDNRAGPAGLRCEASQASPGRSQEGPVTLARLASQVPGTAPRTDRDVAPTNQDVSRMYPGCSRDVAGMYPGCNQGRARRTPRSPRAARACHCRRHPTRIAATCYLPRRTLCQRCDCIKPRAENESSARQVADKTYPWSISVPCTAISDFTTDKSGSFSPSCAMGRRASVNTWGSYGT
ncbi:MAG: hypothetical protein K0R39_3492 [Symbiobacteriaceae bacterium]|jgi:hypothetical protein|nr:hypothetical protein [Symbiobacteriaceae bacterium]